MLSKTSADRGFHDTLSSVLQSQHVGLVLSERLINMPVQVMGPMYTMLSDEMDDAIADVRVLIHVSNFDVIQLRAGSGISIHAFFVHFARDVPPGRQGN